ERVDFFFSSRRRHTRSKRDWSSDVCSSDLGGEQGIDAVAHIGRRVVARHGKGDKLLFHNGTPLFGKRRRGAPGRSGCMTLQESWAYPKKRGRKARGGGSGYTVKPLYHDRRQKSIRREELAPEPEMWYTACSKKEAAAGWTTNTAY